MKFSRSLTFLHAYVLVYVARRNNSKKLEERHKLMQFLMGLNESYLPIRGHIILMKLSLQSGKCILFADPGGKAKGN